MRDMKGQAERFEELLKPSAQALQTAKAYQMKLSFMDEFWTLPPSLAEEFLSKWCRWARRSKLPSMRRLANTLWTHRAGLLRWYFSETSNGILEGINSLLQAAKARARGYRTTRNLLNMAYLLASDLDYALPI
jgi:transposase